MRSRSPPVSLVGIVNVENREIGIVENHEDLSIPTGPSRYRDKSQVGYVNYNLDLEPTRVFTLN